MLPAFRKSPGRTRRGRNHHAIAKTHTVLCPNCGTAKRPHCACSGCGYVRPGLQVKIGKNPEA
ncbi:MAG: 50S ribosomal protein L32 [Phycisphaerales bacterium]|nr:50S ribosomal protein L32 [Phycisphaerales bacterium]